jgi:hypothetical protein
VNEANAWRRCSACKKPIALGAVHWVCSVSTCNRKRTGLAFCSVDCFEVHLPSARHREAWAVEQRAPASLEAPAPKAATPRPAAPAASAPAPGRRLLVRPPGTQPPPVAPEEILVIASRLKDYIRARSGMNTSDAVLEPLSELLRRACDEAIRNAGREGRKTVLERDLPRA